MKVAITVLLMLFCSSCAYAEAIKDYDAIRAIIGEASSDGLSGMRCVASAIRNRGTLKGVYGLKAKHVDREPEWVWKLAKQAWLESKITDFANGASFWEGKSFKEPYWVKSMVLVKETKQQLFYKPKAKK